MIGTEQDRIEIQMASGEFIAHYKKWNVESVMLFGSILRNDFNKQSDIDIAVIGSAPYTLKELIQMELFFEKKFDRKIDVVDLRSDTLDLFVKIDILNTGKTVYTIDYEESLKVLIEQVEWYYRENERYFFIRKRELLL